MTRPAFLFHSLPRSTLYGGAEGSSARPRAGLRIFLPGHSVEVGRHSPSGRNCLWEAIPPHFTQCSSVEGNAPPRIPFSLSSHDNPGCFCPAFSGRHGDCLSTRRLTSCSLTLLGGGVLGPGGGTRRVYVIVE